MISHPQAYLFIRTRDAWGFDGVCTYRRGAFADGLCAAECSDTAIGHGWGGSMSAVDWGERARSAAPTLKCE